MDLGEYAHDPRITRNDDGTIEADGLTIIAGSFEGTYEVRRGDTVIVGPVCTTVEQALEWALGEPQGPSVPTELHAPVVLSWDYRQQPDMDALAAAVLTMSGGTVHLHQVETGSDECAIVLAPVQLDTAAANETYRRWYERSYYGEEVS